MESKTDKERDRWRERVGNGGREGDIDRETKRER